MIFRRKKTSLPAEVYEYRERYVEYDPLELGLTIRRIVLGLMRSAGPERILEAVGVVGEARFLFPFNATVYSAVDVAEILADYADVLESKGKRGYMRLIDDILVLLERADRESLREAGSVIAGEALTEARLMAATPSLIARRVVLSARAKLSLVRVPEGVPLNHGVSFAVRLYREGVRAVHVPDYLRARAVRDSDIVVVPIYAITREGLAVAEPGARPIVEAALEYDRRIYLVGVRSGIYRTMSADDLLSRSEARLGRMSVRAFDLIDPDWGDMKVVVWTYAADASRGKILEIAEQEERAIRDTVEGLIRRAR